MDEIPTIWSDKYQSHFGIKSNIRKTFLSLPKPTKAPKIKNCSYVKGRYPVQQCHIMETIRKIEELEVREDWVAWGTQYSDPRWRNLPISGDDIDQKCTYRYVVCFVICTLYRLHEDYYFNLEAKLFNFLLKGLSFKPSGNYIVSPNLCFLSKRPQILAYCLLFNLSELCKVSARLDNIL